MGLIKEKLIDCRDVEGLLQGWIWVGEWETGNTDRSYNLGIRK